MFASYFQYIRAAHWSATASQHKRLTQTRFIQGVDSFELNTAQTTHSNQIHSGSRLLRAEHSTNDSLKPDSFRESTLSSWTQHKRLTQTRFIQGVDTFELNTAQTTHSNQIHSGSRHFRAEHSTNGSLKPDSFRESTLSSWTQHKRLTQTRFIQRVDSFELNTAARQLSELGRNY